MIQEFYKRPAFSSVGKNIGGPGNLQFSVLGDFVTVWLSTNFKGNEQDNALASSSVDNYQ